MCMLWSCVEEKGWPCLRMALDFKVECQRKEGRLNRTLKIEDDRMKVGLSREDVYCQ